MIANNIALIENIVKVILYLLIIAGIWLLFFEYIVNLFTSKAKYNRFTNKAKKKPESKYIQYIKKNLYIVYGTDTLNAVYTFIIISLCLFIGMLSVAINNVNFTSAFYISVVVGALPFLYIKAKLRTIRIDTSQEAEQLIIEILNQYKVNNFNMIECIDKAILRVDNYKNSKLLLFRLAKKLKEYNNDTELKKILDEMVYSIDTQWSVMLSNNMYLAISEGMIVTTALEDLLKEIKIVKSSNEVSKRLNNEAFVMIKILCPSLYFGSVFAAIYYLDFTATKFFQYQFSEMGFKYFIMIISNMILNVFLLMYFNRRKLDI